MGLLNDIIGLIGSAASADKNNTPFSFGKGQGETSSVGNIIGNALGGGNKSRTIVPSRFPRSVAELQAMPEASLQDEFVVAALSVAVLCNYEQNPQETVNMMNYLRGPRPLSPHEVQFLGERLAGKGYKMRSFFAGSSPENTRTTTPLRSPGNSLSTATPTVTSSKTMPRSTSIPPVPTTTAL